MGKCKGPEEERIMEKAADKETATATAEEGKKRKMATENSELSTSSVQFKTRRLAAVTPENSAPSVNSGNSTCESVSSGDVLASCCSSSRRNELAKDCSKFVDLKQENEVTVEFLTTSAGRSVDFTDRREKRQSNEVGAQSGELESTAMPRETNSRLRSTPLKMPSGAELEEFFVAAENNLHKQFIDKYNYDIVKDEPMEGRYEWVPILLKPCSMKKKKKKKALTI